MSKIQFTCVCGSNSEKKECIAMDCYFEFNVVLVCPDCGVVFNEGEINLEEMENVFDFIETK